MKLRCTGHGGECWSARDSGNIACLDYDDMVHHHHRSFCIFFQSLGGSAWQFMHQHPSFAASRFGLKLDMPLAIQQNWIWRTTPYTFGEKSFADLDGANQGSLRLFGAQSHSCQRRERHNLTEP